MDGRQEEVDLDTSPDCIDSLRLVIRAFKRRGSRLREGFRLSGESASCSLSFSAGPEGAASSFDETAALSRYAALLRPFMAPGSAVELHSVLGAVSSSGLVDPAVCSCLASALEDADNKLFMSMVVNGKAFSSRDVYFAYAEGHLFADDDVAKGVLAQFSMAPAWHLIQFLFHNVCRRYAGVVALFLDAVLELERNHPELAIQNADSPRCIYCLCDDGDFGPEEHVIPEAFGIDELILNGAVCGNCNNALSALDQRLAEFEPLALLRAVNVPLTKKGKFPRASFREFDVQKTKPRELHFQVKSDQDPFVFEDLPDGRVRIQMKAHGRRIFDPVGLARCLFKIGLGLVAHDVGETAACASRYDAARAFILGNGYFPNHLLLSTKVKPDGRVTAAWNDFGQATVVALSIYGVRFAFNIEPTPFDMPPGVVELNLDSCWLGEPVAKP